ncbi:hypothetical protein R3P38DRAFT_3170892 [Favolaschia claudopus]|uniref:Uncharacterized protein n=1 Tax=Favolaschia claudopus TaxID=2862362 RepID=A0AAW0DL75_9AGAR
MSSSTTMPLSTIHNSMHNSLPQLTTRRPRYKLKLFPPPMKSKFFTAPPIPRSMKSKDSTKPQFTINLAEMTEYQILLQRHLDRNEKARVRMAWYVSFFKRRAARKAATSVEEQILISEREREYQAEYRSRNYEKLRSAALKRRHNEYEALFGKEALTAYLRHQQLRRARKRARDRAKEPYDSDDMCQDEEDSLIDDDDDCCEES